MFTAIRCRSAASDGWLPAEPAYTCEACGSTEDRAERRWLEAHERWSYNSKSSLQSLRRLVCLCSECHHVTHYGLAEIQGAADQALGGVRAA